MEHTIKKTTDYDSFLKIESNREVNHIHLRRIKQSIQQRNFLHLFPILINKDKEIVDGQHRLMAARQLGLPVYYMVDDEITKGDIAMMNSNRKSWTARDYIQYYAKEGRSEYKKLLKIITDYPKVTNTAAIKLMNKNTSSYFSGGSMMPPMRAGNLDATHADMAFKICDLCQKLYKHRDYVFRADFILSIKIAVASVNFSAQAACNRIFEKKHLLPDHVEYGEGCTRLLKDIVNH